MDGTCSKEHYLYVHCSLPPPIVNMINDIFLEENKVNTSKEPVTVEQVFVEDIPHISNSIASMTYQYRGLNNEKENGKLYISYPMADAFSHLVEAGHTVDISLGRDYKKEVTQHKRQKNIKGIKFIEKADLDSLLIAHVKATQYLLHDDFSYPTSYENNVKDKFTQEIIYQKQLDKFINQEKKILILSPFALFLLEYRGKSLFDSWLSIN